MTLKLEEQLNQLRDMYARLEKSRAAWEAKLLPQLGGNIAQVQPSVVDAINTLTRQMEEVVRRSDAVLDELTKK